MGMNTTNSPQGVSCIPRRLLLFSKRLRVPGCGVSVMRVGSVGYVYTERERERVRVRVSEREREELSTGPDVLNLKVPGCGVSV